MLVEDLMSVDEALDFALVARARSAVGRAAWTTSCSARRNGGKERIMGYDLSQKQVRQREGRRCAMPARVLAVALLTALGLAAPANGATAYRAIDLGVLPGGDGSQAYAIGDGGEIVGAASVHGLDHAFSYTRSRGMVDLGGPTSVANGVNGKGEVVGQWAHAFLYTPSLGMVDLGAPSISAFGVNDSGELVGTSTFGSSGAQAFSYTSKGGMVELGAVLGGRQSFAYAVSDRGEIVGQIVGRIAQAFSYMPGRGVVDLGLLPRWNYSYAAAVNDSGEIVGYGGRDSISGQTVHAFVYTPRRGMVALGAFGRYARHQSAASGVNDSGQIVGWSDTATSTRAFSYTRSGGMVRLPMPRGATGSVATGVNDSGQIVGYADMRGSRSVQHAILWQPMRRRR
ncbi:MAG: hypothetical protein JO120_12560 [Solirubrobacterales bacterium]|nr:hypothetical protein [Solirubrobacterales bacterium]